MVVTQNLPLQHPYPRPRRQRVRPLPTLRQNVSMALSNEYDKQCITGGGVAPAVNGPMNQLTNPDNPTAVTKFDDFVKAFADQIDGLWASTMQEVSLLVNVAAYKLSAKTFRDIAAADLGSISFADYARQNTGGWWTNKRMPASASTIAQGIVYRTGQPGVRTASHPVWATVAIDDIFTDS